MRRRPIPPSVLVLGLVAALLAAAPARARAQGFVVIVNAANPVSSISRSELSKLFMKKVDRWSNGQPVAPVDLGSSSRVREAFTKEVIGKSPSAVEAFWQQQIFSGRNVPPVTKTSDEDVIAFVRANPNAVGYVSAKAGDTPGVKPLTVTN